MARLILALAAAALLLAPGAHAGASNSPLNVEQRPNNAVKTNRDRRRDAVIKPTPEHAAFVARGLEQQKRLAEIREKRRGFAPGELEAIHVSGSDQNQETAVAVSDTAQNASPDTQKSPSRKSTTPSRSSQGSGSMPEKKKERSSTEEKAKEKGSATAGKSKGWFGFGGKKVGKKGGRAVVDASITKGARLGDYLLCDKLQDGTQSKTYIAYHNPAQKSGSLACLSKIGLGAKVVIKIAPLGSSTGERLQFESNVLKLLASDPRYVQRRADFTTDKYFVLVLDFIAGMSLNEYRASEEGGRMMLLGPHWEADARDVAKQLVDAVADLHARGIAHRDIKSENIMVVTGKKGAPDRLVVIDYGLAILYDPNDPKSQTDANRGVGTPGYAAPETGMWERHQAKKQGGVGNAAASNKGKDKVSDASSQVSVIDPFKLDSYSVGVTIFELVTGERPQGPEKFRETLDALIKDMSKPSKKARPGSWSLPMLLLVRRLTDPNPSTRMTLAEAKSDEWFTADLFALARGEVGSS